MNVSDQADNITALLERLGLGTLAHGLVSSLKDVAPGERDALLRERVTELTAAEVKRLRDAAD